MKPARTLRPLQWVAIDLLALLMVVGWAMTTYALAVGTWKPFGPVTPTYWTLLAFPVAVAVACCIAVLLGWQLNAMGLIGSEEVQRARPNAAEAVTERPATVAVPAPRREERAGNPLPSGTTVREQLRQQRPSYRPQ